MVKHFYVGRTEKVGDYVLMCTRGKLLGGVLQWKKKADAIYGGHI